MKATLSTIEAINERKHPETGLITLLMYQELQEVLTELSTYEDICYLIDSLDREAVIQLLEDTKLTSLQISQIKNLERYIKILQKITNKLSTFCKTI